MAIYLAVKILSVWGHPDRHFVRIIVRVMVNVEVILNVLHYRGAAVFAGQ